MKLGDLFRDREDFGLMILVRFTKRNSVFLYHPVDDQMYEYFKHDQKYLIKVEHD